MKNTECWISTNQVYTITTNIILWINQSKFQFIALKQQNKDYSYFSFESAIIDLRAIDIELNIISDFWVVKRFDGISAHKIKLLPDIDDEETKSLDNYEQLQKLKQFIDENQFEYKDHHFIFQLNNIF